MAAWVGARPMPEVIAAFDEAHAAIGPVYTMRELMADPHVQERDVFVTVDGVVMQAPVARLSRTPGEVRFPGRALGADTDEVLRGVATRRSRLAEANPTVDNDERDPGTCSSRVRSPEESRRRSRRSRRAEANPTVDNDERATRVPARRESVHRTVRVVEGRRGAPQRGERVAVRDLDGDALDPPVVLVAHSGGGPQLPALATRTPGVLGMVLVDASVAPPRSELGADRARRVRREAESETPSTAG